jgi:hypothetical protein
MSRHDRNFNERLAIMEKTKIRLRQIGPPAVRISEIAIQYWM